MVGDDLDRAALHLPAYVRWCVRGRRAGGGWAEEQLMLVPTDVLDGGEVKDDGFGCTRARWRPEQGERREGRLPVGVRLTGVRRRR